MSRFSSLAAVLAVLALPFAPVAVAAEGVATVPEDQIHIVQRGPAERGAVLGGGVTPEKMVKLLAQMPGEVRFIAGEEGDAFKTGDHLAGLDTATLEAKRRAAHMGLNNAMVQYKREVLTPNSQANSMLGGAPSMFGMFSDPMRSMMGQGSPGYERHSNLVGQQTQIEQAQAGVREVEEALKNAISMAPFDGVIVQKMVEVGDVVQPGMPLVVYADTSTLQIQVEVPSRLISALREGEVVTARLDSRSEGVEATVARIFPMANQGGHTTTVKFDLPADSGAQAGMYAEVVIPDPGKQNQARPVIPASAVVWRGSLPAVFLVSEDRARLKMKTLRLGGEQNGKAMVISGLKPGDAILKAPLASTRSGPYQVPAE